MKPTHLLLSLTLAAVSLAFPPAFAADASGRGKPPAEPAAETLTPESKANLSDGALCQPSPELQEAASRYTAAAGEITWSDFMKALKAYLATPAIAHTDPSALMKRNTCLADLGCKIIPAGAARIWTFPKVSEGPCTLVQWSETKTTVIKEGRRRKRVVSTQIARLEPLPVPAGVVLKDARPMDIPVGAKGERGRFLICTGYRRGGAGMWLGSYRLVAEGWRENNEPLSAIPPFLVSNITGILGFSGSDLTVTIKPSNGHPVTDAEPGHKPGDKQAEPLSASYRLVLHLSGGKFTLEGACDDTPYNAVQQFVQALQQGRIDLAKAWLVDPALVSIPKYIGLANKTGETPYRIINMSNPQGSSARYRLVTFDRYDLVMEVIKYKQQWAIKALFVAPADVFLQKIARSVQPLEGKKNASADAGAGDGAPKDEEPARKNSSRAESK